LGGDDRLLTISDEAGNTVSQSNIRDTPGAVTFSDRKQDVRSQLIEGTVSLLMNKRILFLYHIDDSENPIELAFQQKYGEVINYQW
jgi:WD repeat-containing protein 19